MIKSALPLMRYIPTLAELATAALPLNTPSYDDTFEQSDTVTNVPPNSPVSQHLDSVALRMLQTQLMHDFFSTGPASDSSSFGHEEVKDIDEAFDDDVLNEIAAFTESRQSPYADWARHQERLIAETTPVFDDSDSDEDLTIVQFIDAPARTVEHYKADSSKGG